MHGCLAAVGWLLQWQPQQAVPSTPKPFLNLRVSMFTCSGLEGNLCWANELRPLNPFVSTCFPDSGVVGDEPFPRCWQPLNNKRRVRGRPPNPQGSEALLLHPNQLPSLVGLNLSGGFWLEGFR